MKAVLISIQPKWCELIASGKKTIEVRKTRPKIETPFRCYIYMTATKERCRLWEYITAYQNSKGDILNGSQKVIGEFVCDDIIVDERGENADVFSKYAQLSLVEQKKYGANKPLFGWHITDLKIYDKPKELGEFRKPCIDKYQYCQSCKYGLVTLSPDEEEYAMYHGGYYDTFDTVCTNRVTRPPQSWCYVEELE